MEAECCNVCTVILAVQCPAIVILYLATEKSKCNAEGLLAGINSNHIKEWHAGRFSSYKYNSAIGCRGRLEGMPGNLDEQNSTDVTLPSRANCIPLQHPSLSS